MTTPHAESHSSWRMIVDVTLGAVVMGTVGVLIGVLMGTAMVPVAGGIGVILGSVVGLFGGRRFLISILVGAGSGGALAWVLADATWITVGAGAGAAMGGFLGVQLSMLLDMWAERRKAQTGPMSNP